MVPKDPFSICYGEMSICMLLVMTYRERRVCLGRGYSLPKLVVVRVSATLNSGSDVLSYIWALRTRTIVMTTKAMGGVLVSSGVVTACLPASGCGT